MADADDHRGNDPPPPGPFPADAQPIPAPLPGAAPTAADPPPPTHEENDAAHSTDSATVLACPQCRARYITHKRTHGRRVRCRHCNHVWRDDPDAARSVAGALESAAGHWLRLGSTIL